MFEHFKEELISFEKFVGRIIQYYFIATGLLLLAQSAQRKTGDG
jgi:hypothetical protein